MNGFQPPLPNQPQTPGVPQFPQTAVQPPQQVVQPTAPVTAQPAALPSPMLGAPGQVPAPQQPASLPGIQVFEPNMEEIKALADKIAAEGPRRGPSDFYFFKKGDNYVRILPPWSAARKWVRYGARHYNLLGNQRSACYESMHPGAGYVCPIDKVLAVFKQFLDVSQMERRGYHYCNGLVYDYDGARQQFVLQRLKPYVVQLPIFGVYEPMLQLMGRPPFHKLMDLQQGCIVNVHRPESFQGKSNYTVQVVWNGPLAPEESAVRTILSQMHNLDTFADLARPSAEKLQVQVELADGLATALAAACNFTRSQLAQANLLPEKLQLEGAGAQTAARTPAIPGIGQPAVVAAAPAPMAATPLAAPPLPAAAQPSPFPVSPVAAAPTAAPAPTAPVPGPAAGLPPLPPLPQVGPGLPAAPSLPVQVQGSASPAQAAVTTQVPLPTASAGPLPAGPTVPIPTPVRPGQAEPQTAPQPTAAPPAAAQPTADAQSTCPVCNRTFAGVRGLKAHLARSECGATAATQPTAQTPQPQAVQPQAALPVSPSQVQQPAVPGASVLSARPDGKPACLGNYGTQVGCPVCAHRNECAATR